MRIAVRLAAAFLVALLAGHQGHAMDGKEICRLPIPLPPVVSAARLVFLGEMHGTQETPLFAAEFACTLAKSGSRVTLALEMSRTEQPALDAYLASDGGEAARRTLLSTSFWRSTPDGRASTGTLAMIERVRVLRRSGLKLDLLPFDGGAMVDSREPTMATNLRTALEADPGRHFVVLAGNMHAKKTRGNPLDANWESMALRLSDHMPLALNIMPMSGEAWVCYGGPGMCGPQPMNAPPDAFTRGPGLHLGYAPQAGYDGTVLLEKVTAAVPAAAR